jgi:hypothetical protein
MRKASALTWLGWGVLTSVLLISGFLIGWVACVLRTAK